MAKTRDSKNYLRGTLESDKNNELIIPTNIINSLSAAYSQYESMRSHHIDRVRLYTMIEGMVNGNTPYDPALLESEGIDYIANFNNFKAESYVSRTAQLYHSLRNSTELLIKFYLHIPGNPIEAGRYARIMAKNYTDVINEWPGYHKNMDILDNQLAQFGIAPIHWPHEKDWRWEAVDVSRFIVPSKSSSDIEKLSTICIESDYTLQELVQVYVSGAGGWDKEALFEFLLHRANNLNGSANEQLTNALDFQRRLQENDSFSTSFYSETVRLVNMFQKEFSGKISHYIFDRERYLNRSDAKGFLFSITGQYKSINECLCVFTASPGKWTLHSNLGMGHKVLAQSQSVNILDCSVMDMGRLASTLMIRTMNVGGREFGPLKITPGVPNDIGAAEFIPNTLGANINQVVGAAQYLKQSMDVTMMNAGDDPAVPDRSQGSIAPSVARQQSYKEAGFLKNSISHYYRDGDNLQNNQFKRFINSGKNDPGYDYTEEWITRCLEDGVPKEVFEIKEKGLNGLPRLYRKVKAARVAGDGSYAGRLSGLNAINPIIGSMNPKEMSEYKKDYFEAAFGPDAAESYASSDDQQDEINGGASLATVENFMCEQGQKPLFSPDNEQISHMTVHLQKAVEVQKAIAQQQMSPIDGDRIYQNLMPHMGEHFEYMQKTPLLYQTFISQVEQTFRQINQFAQLNSRNAQAMEEAAIRKEEQDKVETEKVMSDEERKDFVAKATETRKDFQVAKTVERADKANETRAEVVKKKAATDIEVAREKARAKNEATAIGRTKNELADTPVDRLREEVTSRIGSTPSGVDFE